MNISSAVAQILTVGMLMAFAGFAAAQQAYPSKPIRLIVPYPPGGGTTLVARLIGQKLTEIWGQQVLVDNRPGGNTIIGSEALVRSPPDGYTIILTTTPHVVNPGLIPYLPYNTEKDFAPVATLIQNHYLLVLNPAVPANTLQEFIALAKSRPGQLNYASIGAGSGAHLAAELLGIMTGVRMQHVPYKGGAQSLTDLIGGQVQLVFETPFNASPHIKTGQLKAIAVTGESRSPILPQVPTFAEAGLPGFAMKNWYGIFAPAGTPRVIIDKLASEIARILVMPDLKERLAAQGTEPFISTPDQLAVLVREDIAKYAKIIRTANIKVDN